MNCFVLFEVINISQLISTYLYLIWFLSISHFPYIRAPFFLLFVLGRVVLRAPNVVLGPSPVVIYWLLLRRISKYFELQCPTVWRICAWYFQSWVYSNMTVGLWRLLLVRLVVEMYDTSTKWVYYSHCFPKSVLPAWLSYWSYSLLLLWRSFHSFRGYWDFRKHFTARTETPVHVAVPL